MTENEIGEAVLGAAMKVHSAVGPGLLESVYETCLTHELRKQGFDVQRQVALPVEYDGQRIDTGFRLDIPGCGKGGCRGEGSGTHRTDSHGSDPDIPQVGRIQTQLPSTPLHDFTYHTIAFPVPSAGGDARAMRAIVKRSRRPEGAGNATRRAALRGPRTSSRAACDAPASRPAFAEAKLRLRAGRRAALLAGNLARPSYGARNRAREY